MNLFKALSILLCVLSFSEMRAQDTLPLRDTTRIADAVILNDSAKKILDTVPLILKDSLPKGIDAITGDTIMKPKHSPRKAAIRSAIIPGWGQAYNRKYWKIPIVYAAIGVPVGTFIYNRNWYAKTRDAARMIGTGDTANYESRVDPQLWVFFTRDNTLGSLLNYRNEFRRNMDYSILITLAMWGLNVIDATVDAHLREFDVSEDLSLKIRPTINNFNFTPGLSVVMTIGKRKPKEYKPVLIP
ncbi:MAG: DUF5683 domain-containing protein [Flavitalea sp.]